jgi:hypothetical protein
MQIPARRSLPVRQVSSTQAALRVLSVFFAVFAVKIIIKQKNKQGWLTPLFFKKHLYRNKLCFLLAV